MKIYATAYFANNHKYGSHVHAVNDQSMNEIIQARGLGETWDQYGMISKCDDKRPSELLRALDEGWPRSRNSLAELIHAICWAGNLAIASGFILPNELFGDTGIIHELCHREMSFLMAPTYKELADRLEEIEDMIPGYCPRKVEPVCVSD